MNLDSITKELQIVLGEAKTTNDCDITASYADSSLPNNFVLGNQNEKSNGTTPVVVVAPPGNSVTQRQVKEVRLTNNDTVAHTVTFRLFDGTNAWAIGPLAQSIPANGAFVYTPESGVVVITGGGGGGSSLTLEDDSGHTIPSITSLQVLGVIAGGSSPSGIVNMTTISGADATTLAAAGGITLRGGQTTIAGAGAGNVAVYGGFSYANAQAGSFYLTGGLGYGVYSGGNFSAGSGPSGALANGAGVSLYAAAGGSTSGNGGAFNIRAGSATDGYGGDFRVQLGLGSAPNAGKGPGNFNVNSDPSLFPITYSWVAGAQLNNQTIFTATRALTVTAVIGRVDVVNGTAATLLAVKAASGTAPSGGTALTSTSMDLTAAANANQTLTPSATFTDFLLAPGDSICLVTTGTLTASAGCITIWGTPQ